MDKWGAKMAFSFQREGLIGFEGANITAQIKKTDTRVGLFDLVSGSPLLIHPSKGDRSVSLEDLDEMQAGDGLAQGDR